MARVTLTTFLSLDGVMQAPGDPDEDRTGGFDHGGWQFPYADDALHRFVGDWLAAADGLLLGRRTYEIFAAYWPNITGQDDPVANRLNTLPKYVASTTLDRVEWNNSRLLRGDVAREVARLREGPGRELQIHGSGTLARTLMNADLIDEYRLWIHPVVLGAGIRLFADGVTPKALRLTDVKRTGTGVVVHVYTPAGTQEYGSFTRP